MIHFKKDKNKLNRNKGKENVSLNLNWAKRGVGNADNMLVRLNHSNFVVLSKKWESM